MNFAEKPIKCASCGADLGEGAQTGRPRAYCSDGCRRVAEYRIRALVRRIEKYELELRELKVHTDHWDMLWRAARLRNLRRWLKQDNAKLRAILGANNHILMKGKP